MLKYIFAICLALTSFNVSARYLYEIKPPVVTTTAVVSDDLSGVWHDYYNKIDVSLTVGKYFASIPGSGVPNTCGKLVGAVVSYRRTVPYNGQFGGSGFTADSSGVGVPFGTPFTLLTGSFPTAGTFSVDGYNPATGLLTISLVTPFGGPNGTFTLNRDPLMGYTATIVPNCP